VNTESPMSNLSRHVIWKQFFDLLPAEWSALEKEQIALCVSGAHNRKDADLIRVIYEAAAYAGWCRGYAEGDGAHRVKIDGSR